MARTSQKGHSRIDPSLISVGENVIVITRRLFVEDMRRHFIGTVTATSASQIRVEGHAWIANAVGEWVRRPELRTRIFSLSSGGEVVLVLPEDADVRKLHYATSLGRLTITDDAFYALAISEFGVGR